MGRVRVYGTRSGDEVGQNERRDAVERLCDGFRVHGAGPYRGVVPTQPLPAMNRLQTLGQKSPYAGFRTGGLPQIGARLDATQLRHLGQPVELRNGFDAKRPPVSPLQAGETMTRYQSTPPDEPALQTNTITCDCDQHANRIGDDLYLCEHCEEVIHVQPHGSELPGRLVEVGSRGSRPLHC